MATSFARKIERQHGVTVIDIASASPTKHVASVKYRRPRRGHRYGLVFVGGCPLRSSHTMVHLVLCDEPPPRDVLLAGLPAYAGA